MKPIDPLAPPITLRYRDFGSFAPTAGAFLVAFSKRTRRPTGTAYAVLQQRTSRDGCTLILKCARWAVADIPAGAPYWPLWWATRRKVGRQRAAGPR